MVYVVTKEEILRQIAQNDVCLCLAVEPDLVLDILLCTPVSTERKEWSNQSQPEVVECRYSRRRESDTTSLICKRDHLAWRKQAYSWYGNNLFETELVLDRVK